MKLKINNILSASFLIVFVCLFSSCNKQESKYDLNVQLKTNINPAYVYIYKNNAFVDSIRFQMDGSINYWDMDVEIGTQYDFEVKKVYPFDTGSVSIQWYRTSHFARQDVLIFDSLATAQRSSFTM